MPRVDSLEKRAGMTPPIKEHWVDPGMWNDNLPTTVCGKEGVRFTKFPERVSCASCRGHILKSWRESDHDKYSEPSVTSEPLVGLDNTKILVSSMGGEM